MWPFNLLKKKSGALHPESLWTIEIDKDSFSVTDQAGETKTVALLDLVGVAIETNDNGPWGADVWWLLFGRDGKLACAFPQGATGENSALDKLMTLPGFDHGQMIAAMGSTDKNVFPVWQR